MESMQRQFEQGVLLCAYCTHTYMCTYASDAHLQVSVCFYLLQSCITLINLGALILLRELAFTSSQITSSSIVYLLLCALAASLGTRALDVCLHACGCLVWAVNCLQIGLVNEACSCRDRWRRKMARVCVYSCIHGWLRLNPTLVIRVETQC